ncbi:MAG: hybrid sensor histidine kinase/response regulator [Balneolaceae bacterium]|nr:hybrid sensor histidine kinase/response regulator [Balneolaceae bacterium]
MNNDNTATVLIVDDTEQNVRLLTHVVKKEGYNVLAAFSGEDALDLVEKRKPDIILLDVMMPNMNGFEVCRKLKEQEEYKDIPVIFLSALTEPDSKVKGFEAGGVDYITKPFQREEVLARIDLHVDLQSLRDELEQKVKDLQEREQMLKQLNEQKDQLLRIVAHDIRNPVSGIIGVVDILKDEIQDSLDEEQLYMLESIEDSGKKLLRIVNELLEKKIDEEKKDLNLEDVNLHQLVRQILNLHEPIAITKDIKLEMSVDEDLVIRADSRKIDQVIGNLISNALKFTDSGGEVEVGADILQEESDDKKWIKLWVSDTGVGITDQKIEKLSTSETLYSDRYGTWSPGGGIGYKIINHYIELHGGKIDVRSVEGEGTTVTITLPLSP